MMNKSYTIVTLIAFAIIVSCAVNTAKDGDIESVSDSRALALDKAFSALLKKHKINTAGIAVIKNAKVVWQNQYGQQAPGIPASVDTLFNVASITKTVTAETILRLVADGKLSLDEPMSGYWIDPDLKDDPTHQQLTARMVLTHTSGFMNWRFFSDDYKLKFVNEPGTTFGYSGEGFQYVAKYAANKLGVPFEELVKSYIFDSIGMSGASISVREENFQRIAKPLDEGGKFYGYYCRPEGYCRKEGDYSVAGDMVITVADYAKFLISSMHGEGLNTRLVEERDSVQVTSYEIDCSATPGALCPTRLGYGLGWNVTQLADDKLIGHSGSDWSSVALVYYYSGSRDGLIVFFNAPNRAGIAGMVDSLELLDPDSPKLHEYKARLARTNT